MIFLCVSVSGGVLGQRYFHTVWSYNSQLEFLVSVHFCTPGQAGYSQKPLSCSHRKNCTIRGTADSYSTRTISPVNIVQFLNISSLAWWSLTRRAHRMFYEDCEAFVLTNWSNLKTSEVPWRAPMQNNGFLSKLCHLSFLRWLLHTSIHCGNCIPASVGTK